jgi:GlcNAc-PI de-N-acetylase
MIRFFVSPHADDETLSMLNAIVVALLNGDEVHVCLASNGSTSSAFAEINGLVDDGPYWGGGHNPAVEGYAPLTLADLAEARTKEFRSACGQAGVLPENIHLGRPGDTLTDLPDAVSAAWAQELSTAWADHFEALGQTVAWGTMWWYDASSDHARLGQEWHRQKLADPTRFADCTFFIKVSERTTAHAVALGVFAFPVPPALAATVKTRLRHASLCYGAWNPAADSYAIGRHSVGTLFDAVAAGGPTYAITRLS